MLAGVQLAWVRERLVEKNMAENEGETRNGKKARPGMSFIARDRKTHPENPRHCKCDATLCTSLNSCAPSWEPDGRTANRDTRQVVPMAHSIAMSSGALHRWGAVTADQPLKTAKVTPAEIRPPSALACESRTCPWPLTGQTIPIGSRTCKASAPLRGSVC
jgi:hypothetical protein